VRRQDDKLISSRERPTRPEIEEYLIRYLIIGVPTWLLTQLVCQTVTRISRNPPTKDGAMSSRPAGADEAADPGRWDRMPDFALTLERLENGTAALVLAGELDLYRAPEIEEALAQAIEGPDEEPRGVTVDLRSVTFLDSTALAMLLDATRRQRARGSELIVLVGPQTPTTAFEVTGFDRLLAIRRTDRDLA
jgi:anti-sigma B factor antagonist